MSRSFRNRMQDFQKKSPPAVTAEDISSLVDKLRTDSNQPSPTSDPSVGGTSDAHVRQNEVNVAGTTQRVLYGDVSVCQALGIRRRVIAAARTKNARGRDWDCLGLHAGMTKEWVDAKALEIHVVPKFDLLKPIQPDDGVVSCVLSGVVPNNRRAIAEIVATGERIVVWVSDSSMMKFREIFDCYDDNGTISMRRDLNEVSY